MRGNRIKFELYEQETSDWADWIKSNLPFVGIDAPSEEVCLLIAAKSVGLAQQVLRISKHLPASLRTTLIEAAILHQCWKRQVELHKRKSRIVGSAHQLVIPHLDAVAILHRHSSVAYTVEASDSHRYLVTFPLRGNETTLATQVLCGQVAREIGLPIRPSSLIFLGKRIALNAGIRSDCHISCLSKETFCPLADRLCCLGSRECEVLEIKESGRPDLPLSPKTFHHMVGRMVFDYWVLNSVSEVPTFRNVSGRAEPIFGEFSHCLMGGDWPDFLRATIREQVPRSELVSRIRSYQQLEAWIRRIEDVNLDSVAELVVKLPSYWYGGRPTLLSSVIAKLGERRRDLRGVIHHLVRKGHFPNLSKAAQWEGVLAAQTSVLGEIRNVRKLR